MILQVSDFLPVITFFDADNKPAMPILARGIGQSTDTPK